MMPKLPYETRHAVLLVIAAVLVNVLLTNLIWRAVGSKRRTVRRVGQIAAACLGIANLGLGVVCLLRLLHTGPEWMYVVLGVVAFVFAYRVGGATRGEYP